MNESKYSLSPKYTALISISLNITGYQRNAIYHKNIFVCPVYEKKSLPVRKSTRKYYI
jgi:hypothetical protein